MLLLKIQVKLWLNNMNSKVLKKKGFTLVEIMVSVSIFAIVMLFVGSSIYSVFDSNRKSQSLRTVMDNLNFSLETMTRTIRFGKNYHCNINSGASLATPLNCSNGADSIAVLDSNGSQVVYKLVSGRIVRSINGGTDYYVTGSDVTITNLTFRVYGADAYSTSGDLLQPQVIVVLSGYSGAKATIRSTFNLETTISQRVFDSQ